VDGFADQALCLLFSIRNLLILVFFQLLVNPSQLFYRVFAGGLIGEQAGRFSIGVAVCSKSSNLTI
jgi:hypothetical protein